MAFGDAPPGAARRGRRKRSTTRRACGSRQAPRGRPAEDRTVNGACAGNILGDRAADDALRRSCRGQRTRPKRPQRAIHSIIGPNGAGKTTVFNCIMQNSADLGGRIWFRGERIDGLTPDRVAAAGVSRTYQNIRLFRNVTAMENLLVGMHLHLRSHWWGALINSPHTRRNEKEAHDEALKLLRFVGLNGRGDVLARNLAYGEQRRLEIGRALATRPKLLMLDEPTAGMNPRETSEMMAFIREARARSASPSFSSSIKCAS